MAGIIQAGYVAKQGEDVLPTTGPHLDVRVLKDGQFIDPATWRTGLQRLKVGKQRTPLYTQKDGEFKPSFSITSGYGPRTAPTAGASTDHKGIDYGVAGGEPLYWEGAGTFKPGKGYGSIMTPEGYEVRLLHTKGGQETSLGGMQQPQQPQPVQQLPGQTTIVYLNRGQRAQPQEDGFERALTQQFLNQYISDMQPRKTFDPVSLLTSAMSTTPDYFS